MMNEVTSHNPTIQIPPWPIYDDPAMAFGDEYASMLLGGGDSVDAYASDEFRMYEFKVSRCARGRSHDWTECPYAHPCEKARRRDPRKYHYSGTACPDFRKGSCKRGDSCEFAHGVFECWLHPARYRTQPCKDGTACRRRVCFFAHTPEQLRVLPQSSPRSASGGGSGNAADSYDGSPMRHAASTLDAYLQKTNIFSSSPTSTLMSPPMSPPESPPMSPAIRRGLPAGAVNEVLASLRQLQLSKAKSAPTTWGFGLGSPSGSGFGPVSPRVRAGCCSLPSTPTRATGLAGLGWAEGWDRSVLEEEPMERVESGRDLRAKIFEKLSKENSIERSDGAVSGGPDVGWVSELVK
ncbi:Zinc finger CCCH domain-containing protein 20 [Acorus gramineus]|uniref:Zinc finger CCCH domain-containing protein 20 n=1 Tax=Acorus gramineus TaxID=55184 RepID=A0AAV9AS88_ACOGR|nr:Zinc finger CCCH domain-containing protein 20 [Acorus gramineus]